MTEPGAPRAMRADARRNAERLIAAARDAFAERGAEAPLDDIARRAGVGPGTLYRHFPTREALIEAVYRDDIAELTDLAYRLLDERAPGEALEAWVRAQVSFVTRRHGVAMTLKAMLDKDSETFAWVKATMLAAAGAILARAQDAGTVRPDVEPGDLLRLGHGIGMMTDGGTAEGGDRLLAVMLDGLRTREP